MEGDIDFFCIGVNNVDEFVCGVIGDNNDVFDVLEKCKLEMEVIVNFSSSN